MFSIILSRLIEEVHKSKTKTILSSHKVPCVESSMMDFLLDFWCHSSSSNQKLKLKGETLIMWKRQRTEFPISGNKERFVRTREKEKREVFFFSFSSVMVIVLIRKTELDVYVKQKSHDVQHI